MKKIIVLLSGGLDSSVCAAIAKSEGYELYGLTINYGQKHVKELEAAKLIAKDLDFKGHIIVEFEDLKKVAVSSLTSDNIENPKDRNLDQIGEGIPESYVPGRNMIFLSIAASYAEKIGAEKIFVGFNNQDYSGYPDCRKEFIKSMQGTISKALAKTTSKELSLSIEAPLLDLSKKEIILKGDSLGIDFSHTWSCYEGKDSPCNRCDTCKLRALGFKEAGITDSLVSKEKKVYFVSGNKYKIDIFNKVMQPYFKVESYVPEEEIEELNVKSVKEVVVDKLEKSYSQFAAKKGFLFVTDVGLYISQIDGRPGALIKRETKSLFDGDFKKWCSYLDENKPRDAFVQMIIAAKDDNGNKILVDHKIHGKISVEPQPGDYGFAWDEIFVPNEEYVSDEYKGKSFAQIPEEVKFGLLMDPPILEFKSELKKYENG